MSRASTETAKTGEAYLAAAPEAVRPRLARIRAQIRKAVPRAMPPRTEDEAAATPRADDGEAKVHQAQVFVVRRRPRRRFFWRRPWRRRRFY